MCILAFDLAVKKSFWDFSVILTANTVFGLTTKVIIFLLIGLVFIRQVTVTFAERVTVTWVTFLQTQRQLFLYGLYNDPKKTMTKILQDEFANYDL